MHAFRRSRQGFTSRLTAQERTIIGNVVADVATLLGYPVGDPVPGADGMPVVDWTGPQTEPDPSSGAEHPEGRSTEPQDPALARLLPPASEDEEIADELRRLNEATLRSAKAARLHRVWEALSAPGEKVFVPAASAMDWAGALTDVRLVLAVRLGLEDEEDAAALYQVARSSTDQLASAMASLYLALSWLQETLLEAMLRDLPG